MIFQAVEETGASFFFKQGKTHCTKEKKTCAGILKNRTSLLSPLKCVDEKRILILTNVHVLVNERSTAVFRNSS